LAFIIAHLHSRPLSLFAKKKGGKSVEKRDDWGNDIMFISLTMSDGTLAKRKFLERSNDVKLLFWD